MPNTSESGSRCHDEAAEEEGPCWYDLGSYQHHDDARSWSSLGDRHHQSTSSAKSGSVGSNDESNVERGSYRGSSSAPSFRVVGYASHHAAHMVNGETKFPTATSYVSDAQRSDVATVCSGSVAEDIEVESVVSQEDQIALAASSPSNHRSRSFPGTNRVVEFAGLPATEPPDKYLMHDRASPPHVRDVNAMGPPLSRALLLRAEGGISSSRAGSVKSFGSTGSELGESNTPRNAGTSSNLSYGGGDDGPFENETDEAGSLDVETHSIGTRSVHSQDDAPPYGEDDGAFDRQPSSMSISGAVTESRTAGTLAEVERNVNGGRQSPGGTIYKGRGTRRYQGRYMHLPLKRFHHDGVHLETYDNDDPHSAHGRKRPYVQQYDSRWNDRQPEVDESTKPRQRYRSRSRSRSRSPAEDDRKPSASNHIRIKMMATDDLPQRQHCTFAVTGEHKANQAIYVCRTCSTTNSTREKAVLEAEGYKGDRSESDVEDADARTYDDSQRDQLLCVCQGCAETCHAEHNGLEYIGFGPAYCDCRVHGSLDECSRFVTCCQLVQPSNEAAARMNLTRQRSAVQDDESATVSSDSYRMEAFAIPELVDEGACHQLCQSACMLGKLSKETFWIDPATVDVTSLCDLEKLALSVYQYHASSAEQHFCGAEWWVQVKPAHDPATGAVDLHFDKDEAVAESFGLGYFPHLSTVTYLTGSGIESDVPGPTNQAQPLSPTIVLSRVYGENHNDGKDVDVLISHPRRGKHLVFDGRLLHGAPAALELREAPAAGRSESASESDVASQVRVTFLVNIWSQHRPASVETLPEEVRNALKNSQAGSLEGPFKPGRFDCLSFRRLTVPERVVSSAQDLCSDEPLFLPFVSRNATWAVSEDEEEVALSLLLPREVRQSNLHTVLFHFDADLSPFLTSAVDGDGNSEDGSYSAT